MITPSRARRRGFLTLLLSGAAIAIADSAAVAAPVKTTLAPKATANLMRVRMEMDVKGNVRLPSNPLVSRKSQTSLPITSDVVLDYEERYQRPANADARSDNTTVERFYHTARSNSTLNKTSQSVELRESVRQTVVRRETTPEVIYGVEDYFTNDEIGLLRAPVCSAGVDQLLPVESVAEGDKYRPDAEALVSVLNLTSVENPEVVAEIMEITADKAKIQLSGNLQGTVEGVPTKLRVLGKLTFDRDLGTCTWVAMAIHETREIGNAEPGFDVAATIKMVRQPLSRPIALSKDSGAVRWNQPIPQDRLYVELRSQHVGFSALMDRGWRMMSDVTGSAVMRWIENDISIAQCNFRSLVRLKPGQQWTLDALQADARKTLGDQFSQMISADQTVSAQGLRVLRLVADGAAEGVPIRWIMLHFSDDDGRRILATFTMSGNQVDRFAGTDSHLADSLRLIEPKRSDEVAGSPSAAAGVPKARLSDAKLDVSATSEVQSASDLR